MYVCIRHVHAYVYKSAADANKDVFNYIGHKRCIQNEYIHIPYVFIYYIYYTGVSGPMGVVQSNLRNYNCEAL